jgi:hypothetical protein
MNSTSNPHFARVLAIYGPPKVLAADKISGLIRGLPAGAKFSLSGISYFNNNLYVGTNLGIIEISGGKPTELFQIRSSQGRGLTKPITGFGRWVTILASYSTSTAKPG